MSTLSVFLDVPAAQKLEGSLLKTYKQDTYSKKMFLAYKVCMTQEGQPWASFVVHKIRRQIAQDPSLNYEYLPVMGMKSFIQASLGLLFGKHSPVIVENRAGGVHTVGDSGAFQLGAQFLKTWRGDSQIVYVISSQVEQHGLIFQDMGFIVFEFSFWDSEQLCMDPNILFNLVKGAPDGCIFVIGNIDYCKLTQCQWTKLMATMKRKRIFPFFDIPYQGLSTGDLEEDTRFLQYFISEGFEFFCSQSLSKSFGIYDEGVGMLAVVALNNQLLLCVLSQLMNFALALWLNPPTSGARIITSILCNPALYEAWKLSLKEVAENIMLIKEKFKEKLRLLGTPGSWDHITNQDGTHGYLGLNWVLGLNPKQVIRTQSRPRGRLLQPSGASRLPASPSQLCPLRLANGEVQNCVPAEQILPFSGEKNLPTVGLVPQGDEETGWMKGLVDSLSDDWESPVTGGGAPPAGQE